MGFIYSMSCNLSIWGVFWMNQVQTEQSIVESGEMEEGCGCHQVPS